MNCVNCFSQIDGRHKSVECSKCGAPLHNTCKQMCECGETLCDECAIKSKKCAKCSEESLPTTIRRSHIELYAKCPHAFYLEVIKGFGHQQTVYTESGIDLHELFDEYSHDKDLGTFEEIFQKFALKVLNYPEHFFESIEHDTLLERASNNIHGFLELRNELQLPYMTETKLEFSVGNNLPKVNITMDRIDLIDENTVEIGDYKTGKVITGQDIVTNMQVPLYIYAVREELGKTVQAFNLYYLGERKVRRYERIDDDKYICRVGKKEYIISIQEAIREVKKLFGRIKNKEYSIPHDLKPYKCTICQFYNTHCEGSDKGRWQQAKHGGK